MNHLAGPLTGSDLAGDGGNMSLIEVPGTQVNNFVQGGVIESPDMQYISQALQDLPAGIVKAFFPKDGFLKNDAPTLSSAGADTIDVGSGTVVWSGIGILVIDPPTYPDLFQAIPFPNAASTVYYVYADITFLFFFDVRIEPYSGKPYYTQIFQTFGHGLTIAHIGWDGQTMTFTFDNYTNYAGNIALEGRKVRIFALNQSDLDSNSVPRPYSPIQEVAIQDLTIGSGGIAQTTVPFGQDTPSTNPDDYIANLLGPVISDAAETAVGPLIGTVTGSGAGTTPTQFDVTGQRLYDLDALWAQFCDNY